MSLFVVYVIFYYSESVTFARCWQYRLHYTDIDQYRNFPKVTLHVLSGKLFIPADFGVRCSCAVDFKHCNTFYQ